MGDRWSGSNVVGDCMRFSKLVCEQITLIHVDCTMLKLFIKPSHWVPPLECRLHKMAHMNTHNVSHIRTHTHACPRIHTYTLIHGQDWSNLNGSTHTTHTYVPTQGSPLTKLYCNIFKW